MSQIEFLVSFSFSLKQNDSTVRKAVREEERRKNVGTNLCKSTARRDDLAMEFG